MFLDPQVLKKVFDVFGVFFRNFSSGQCYVPWSWNIVLMVGIFKIFRKTGLFCNILGCVMYFFNKTKGRFITRTMYYSGNVIVIYIKAGDKCFCGNKLGEKKSDSECKTPCTGDKEQVCGGSWRLAVYKNTKFVPRELLSFKQGDKVTLTKTFFD